MKPSANPESCINPYLLTLGPGTSALWLANQPTRTYQELIAEASRRAEVAREESREKLRARRAEFRKRLHWEGRKAKDSEVAWSLIHSHEEDIGQWIAAVQSGSKERIAQLCSKQPNWIRYFDFTYADWQHERRRQEGLWTVRMNRGW